MKIISKLNSTTKVLLLFVYTAILFVASTLIISGFAEYKPEPLNDYQSKPYDENLEIMLEVRGPGSKSTSSSAVSSYAYRYYTIHLIGKDKTKVYQNVKIYFDVETKKGDIVCKEVSEKSNSSKKLNPSGEFNNSKSYMEFSVYNNKTTYSENEPLFAYIKIQYEIADNEEAEYTKHELRYAVEIMGGSKIKADEYEQITISEDKSVDLNEYRAVFTYNHTHNDETNDCTDRYFVTTKFSPNAEKEVEETKVAVVIESSLSKEDEKYFNDRFEIIEYYGCVQENIELKSNYSAFFESAQMSKVYLYSYTKYNDYTESSRKLWFDINEIK